MMDSILIRGIESFSEFSQFKSLKDFNNNIEQWMIDYKHQFTSLELIALKRLIRYSAKVYGVANARINTILNAIKEKDFQYGVSRSTFKRMINKAKKIGLLEVKQTVRNDQSQSSNIYIFQRFHTIEPPRTKSEHEETAIDQEKDVSQLNHHKTSNLSFKTNNSKTSTLTDIDNINIDHTYLPNFIEQSFIETAKPFFRPEEVYKLWLRVLIAYRRSGISKPLSEVIEVVNRALKVTVFTYKQGRIKTSLEGYFYRLMETDLAVEKRKENKNLINCIEACFFEN